VSEQKIKLSVIEVNKIALNAEKLKVVEKDTTILELKNKMLTLQEEMLKKDRMILDYHKLILDSTLSTTKDKNKDTLLEISSKYPITNGKKWGYNPESGEIVINEEL